MPWFIPCMHVLALLIKIKEKEKRETEFSVKVQCRSKFCSMTEEVCELHWLKIILEDLKIR